MTPKECPKCGAKDRPMPEGWHGVMAYYVTVYDSTVKPSVETVYCNKCGHVLYTGPFRKTKKSLNPQT